MSSLISRNFNTFGEALKWLLDERGMSQEEFAERLVIDEGTISKYVNNKINPPRPRRIKRFCDLLGGQLKKQSNNTWTASMDKKVKDAINAVNEAKETSTLYKGQEPTEDEIVQSLELAEKLIQRSLLILKKNDRQ